MKNYLVCFFVFVCGSLFAYPQHSPQLKNIVDTLYQLEETKQLIQQVESTGKITIKTAMLGKNDSNALWVPDERTIYINFSKRRTTGNLLCSIIFELHNALKKHEFDHLDNLAARGVISKEKYIESVEYLEYTNALETVKILKKGVAAKVFPADTHWAIANTFKEHYYIQIQAGHSQHIGYNYDAIRRLSSYQLAKKW